jgi:hypothetical protein
MDVDPIRDDPKTNATDMAQRYKAAVAKGPARPMNAVGKWLLTGGLLISPTCGGHFNVQVAIGSRKVNISARLADESLKFAPTRSCVTRSATRSPDRERCVGSSLFHWYIHGCAIRNGISTVTWSFRRRKQSDIYVDIQNLRYCQCSSEPSSVVALGNRG